MEHIETSICFLQIIFESFPYECTGLTDFELTNGRDPPTHPLIEMLTHLKIPNESPSNHLFDTLCYSVSK